MKIKINGKTEVISDNINNLSMLIDFLEGKIPKLFAIEKNGKII